jgi:hypothetical protein
MIPYAELEAFFCDLVARAQERGIPCAITSGMACVHFGVAATTMDCDVLCLPEKSEEFRALVAGTELHGLHPVYRGHISPPLDARWMRGGWTSHIMWKTKPEETCLDVFGVAPRSSTAWEEELHGLYASRHTVAEMKRTNREKDWPCITGIGVKMLMEGDPRGVLHLHERSVLAAAVRHAAPAAWMLDARPALRLAVTGDDRLEAALHAEIVFWHRLDACRIVLYERALRPYVSAVRRATARRAMPLAESHAIRMECAARWLHPAPVSAYGFGQLIADAREATAKLVHPSLMEWLPNGLVHFTGMP